MSDYLIIDVHEAHREAAKKALPLSSRAEYAGTLEVALRCLTQNHYDGLLANCYFPAGGEFAGRTDIGQRVIEMTVEPSDPRTELIDYFVQKMRKQISSDAETTIRLCRYGWSCVERDLPLTQWPLYVVAKTTSGKEGSGDLLSKLLRDEAESGYRSPPERSCDAMRETQGKEPLGIMVSELLAKRIISPIPHLLLFDTIESSVDKFILEYCHRQSISSHFAEYDGDMSSPLFWQDAFHHLETGERLPSRSVVLNGQNLRVLMKLIINRTRQE